MKGQQQAEGAANISITGGTYSTNVSDFCADGYTQTEIKDEAGNVIGYGVAETVYVAKVDNVKYATLQEAINAAKGGSTVRLLADVTLTETAVFPAKKSVHINLMGHNITATGTALLINGTTQINDTKNTGTIESTGNVAVAVGNDATLTVYSGTLKGREGAVITGKSTGATIEIRTSKPTLIATDNAVIAGNGSDREGKPNTIQVKGGTLIGNIESKGYIACGIYAPWNDNVTVSGGTFNITNGAGIVARAGTVKVTGGTFNCTGEKTGWVGDNKNQLPCAALVFDKAANYPALTDASQILVSGGTFSTDPAANGAIYVAGYQATKQEDGTYQVKKKNPVAEIDGVEYDTLISAIAAAEEAAKGGKSVTIKLLADVNTTTNYRIGFNSGKLTIDLNGHNITGGGNEGVFYVYTSADLTITGEGTITAVEQNKAAMAVQVYSDNAKVTLKGGTYTQQITNTNDPHFDLIYAHHGTIVIEGGKYECHTPEWTLNCFDENHKNGTAKIEVTGGTFKRFDPSKNTAEGEGTNFLPAGFEAAKDENGNFTVAKAMVAEIVDGEKYETLQKAIDAANAGETVMLLNDVDANIEIAAGKNFTLDLNGHTINGGTGTAKATILNKGTVTITDSSEAKTGTIKRNDQGVSGETSYYVIRNIGTMTIEQAIVTNNSGYSGSSLICNGDDDAGGTLNIKGGEFSQNNFIAIKNGTLGTLNVTGGTISSKQSAIQNWCVANITGGTINGLLWTDGFVYEGVGYVGRTTIGENANFTGKVFMDSTNGSVKPTLVINGGTLNVSSWNITAAAANAGVKPEVSGGTFSSAVPEAYCAEGYVPKANEDGTYGVAKAKVAEVSGMQFDTLQAAIDAATAGQTVKLLQNVTLDETLVVTKQITLDLNGKTISNTNDIWDKSPNSWSLISVRENGNLTITGNGTLKAKENDCYALDTQDATAKLTIQDGTFVGNVSTVYAESGEVTINGGSYSIQQLNSNGVQGPNDVTINCLDAHYKDGTAKVTINGGTFDKFDPRNTAAEGKGSSFVAPGVGVNAESGSFTAVPNMVAQVLDAEGNSVKAYGTLQDAINEAADGYTVQLIDDAYPEETLKVGSTKTEHKTLTLDLNGHSIVRANSVFMVQNANLTVTGNGTIKESTPYYGAIAIKGSNNASDTAYTTVTVGSGVTLEAWSPIFITPYESKGAPYAYGVTVNINGATLNAMTDSTGDRGSGVYINGQIKHLENAPVINLAESTTIRSTGNGIYAAGYAVWTLNANIDANLDALSIKSGKFTITGGSYAAHGEYKDPAEANGNGSEQTGAALSITTNDGYAKNIDVTVNGGTFTSANGHAVYEGIATKKDGKPAAAKSGAALKIANGSFTGASGKDAVAITRAENKEVISGGTYSTDVSAFCVDGFEAKKNGDSYSIKEVEGNAMIENADGTKTYGDLVKLLADAKSGQTVKVIKDNVEAAYIRVRTGVTLDLNGKTVTVDSDMAVSTGSIIDTGKGAGALKVSMEALTTTADNGGYLPLYDSANNAYHFFKGELKTYGVDSKTEPGKVTFWFRLLLEEKDGYKYLADGNNHGAEIYVRLRWTGLPDSQYWYIPMSAGTLNKLATSANPTNYYMYVYLTGTSVLGSTTIYGKPIAETDAGYTSSSDEASCVQAG